MSTSGPPGPRIVIVGGVAGGATAAARIMRVNANAHVTVIERSPDVSIAGCGLPYYLGREITDRTKLSLHTPQSLKRAIGVSTVRVRTDAYAIDLKTKSVEVRSMVSGRIDKIPFDKLLLSPGAMPIMPYPLHDMRDPRIVAVRTLSDVDQIDHMLHSDQVRHVTVVGAGYIGLEMVEQLHRTGKKVMLIEKKRHVLPQADEEMARFLHHAIEEAGVELVTDSAIKSINCDDRDHIKFTLEHNRVVQTDLLIMSIGIRPDTALAKTAKIAMNNRGQIIVDQFMRTNVPDIYAVGDAVETNDLVFPNKRAWVALGNVANMQARIAADHMVTGKSIPYPGSLGTSIVRCFDMVYAGTGWTEFKLQQAGIAYQCTHITQPHHAGYYPGAQPLTIKVIFDPETGRILGGQAIGTEGIDKRIDVIATAIMGKLTIDDLSLTQLTYSPPFGSARDPANVAGLAARNLRDGLVSKTESMATGKDAEGNRVEVIDVRVPEDRLGDKIPGLKNIVYYDLARPDVRATLDKSVKYKTLCNWGKTAYFAHRHLKQAGFKTEVITGGRRVQSVRDEAVCKDTARPGSKL